MKEPLVLAIDTSCDETSASVVKGLNVLSNVLPSQIQFHKKYGGVVPSIAKLKHTERIDNVVADAMAKAKVSFDDLDYVAVTYGPGLAIALEVGINKAKEICNEYNKPLYIVNHMEGHAFSAVAVNASDLKEKILTKEFFPSLAFLISGKHTELVLITEIGEYKKIGETLDDACGEAFDKCGRLLGLGYPAGGIITKFAKENRENITIKIYKNNKSTLIRGVNKKTGNEYELPIAMANSGDLNFSFSGLKTAFRELVSQYTEEFSKEDEIKGNIKGLNKQRILDLCVMFEVAAIKQLQFKLDLALQKNTVKNLLLGGGVIASPKIRLELKRICKKYNIPIHYPTSKKLTTDNAAMIGIAANLSIINKMLKQNLDSFTNLNKEKIAHIFINNFEKIDRDPSLSF